MDWSVNNLLVWQQADVNDVQQIWTCNPDGSNLRCLSLLPGWPALNKQKLSPRFSPDGNHIVLSYEQSSHAPSSNGQVQNGWFCDLAICNADGSGFTPVVAENITYTPPFGAAFALFTATGNGLIWTEILDIPSSSAPGDGQNWWGTWRIQTAGVSYPGGVPLVGAAATLVTAPNAHIQYSNDISSDNSLLLYVSDSGSTEVMDIWTYNTSTHVNTNVTASPNNWDEHPAFVPGTNNQITWMSSRPFPGYLGSLLPLFYAAFSLRTEFVTMHTDGTQYRQLSNFATAGGGHPEYQLGAKIVASEIRYSPDGSEVLMQAKLIGSSRNLYGILTLATGAWRLLPTATTTGYQLAQRSRR